MLIVWLRSRSGSRAHAFEGAATNPRCNTTTRSDCDPLPSLAPPCENPHRCRSCVRHLDGDRDRALRRVINVPLGAAAAFRAAVGG